MYSNKSVTRTIPMIPKIFAPMSKARMKGMGSTNLLTIKEVMAVRR